MLKNNNFSEVLPLNVDYLLAIVSTYDLATNASGSMTRVVVHGILLTDDNFL